MIDISTIPAPRLAMLDNTVLFHGNHSGTGPPDCKHCARELLHEVVTGRHLDATPPGGSMYIAILPGLNDGPWRDDAHRTSILRPYLRKMLGLDPAKDEQRLYAIINYAYRHIMPEICDAMELDKHGAALRDLPAIIDCAGANKSTDIFVEAVKDALDLDLGFDLDLALDIALSRALALDFGLGYDLELALGLASDLDLALASDLDLARDLGFALGLAIGLARARGYARLLAIGLARTCAGHLPRDRSIAESWERSVTALLDIICGM